MPLPARLRLANPERSRLAQIGKLLFFIHLESRRVTLAGITPVAASSREDIPKPNYVVNASPDHWQVSWKVQGFGKEQAEAIMRGLVRKFGADPAATSSNNVGPER